jgi:hypothetical protein
MSSYNENKNPVIMFKAGAKILEGVMEAGLGHIRFAPPATLQTLKAEFSVCSVRQSEHLREKKKTSSKLSKIPRYRTKYSLLLLGITRYT